MTKSTPSAYLNHLSVAIWAALAALLLGATIQAPQRVFTIQIFGSPLSVVISMQWVAGLVALAVVSAGMEAAIRTHPKPQLLRHTYRYWALPGALALTAAALLPLVPGPTARASVLVICGLALTAATVAEYHTIDPEDGRRRNARLALNIMAYALAALAFVLIYNARSRSLVSATLIGSIAGLLASDLLRDDSSSVRGLILYSGVVAMIMAQVTWLLNYWPYASVRMGLALLVLFYLLVGLASQDARNQLSTRRALEYLTAAGAAALVVFWFPI
ncbi:MAG: hypothetical protein GXP42_16465 [Chloroflexi bacterium]|nr:hypothetical protein [Chloroflexota bacterium]